MIQILNKSIDDTFFSLVESSKVSIKLCAPFVKESIVKKIYENKKKNVKLDLVTNFNLQYFHKRSSDIEAMEIINQQNGNLFNNQYLHAKFYIFDDKYIIITSANLTLSGLSKNVEYGVLFDESHLIKQVLNDFEEISTSDYTGSIQKDAIDSIKNILQFLPKYKNNTNSVITDTVEIDDIIEVHANDLTQNMSLWNKMIFDAINMINKQEFSLVDIYAFEKEFKTIFPNNNTVKGSIRRNLQELRDLGLIKFCGNGHYKKLWRVITEIE